MEEDTKVLVYGSINIDVTYRVPHIVRKGETIPSIKEEKGIGGKGANQSVALSKAGSDVYLAGRIGSDGVFILYALEDYGVKISNVAISKENPTGKAIIQVDAEGDNSIILFPGANALTEKDHIDAVLSKFKKGDYLVLQNEINNLEYLINKGRELGLVLCLNPSPITEEVLKLDYSKVDIVFINEIEGKALLNSRKRLSYEDMAHLLGKKYPKTEIVLTLGSDGSYYINGNEIVYQGIIDYPVFDTTAAGDTFLGYFIASRIKGKSVNDCLYYASKASGIAVSSTGAAKSIPSGDIVYSEK